MRLAKVAAGLAAVATVVCGTSGTARAGDRAIELGFRTGYALPMGDEVGGNPSVSLGDVISGVLPFWFDVGYRFNQHMMVGGFLQYGVGFVNTGKQQFCTMGGLSCSANDVMVGAQFHYHIIPDGPWDPWVGAGIGYEIQNFSQSGGGQPSATLALNGFQFLNLQGGVDYKLVPNFGVGPFLMLSFGEYSNCGISPNPGGGSCTVQNSAIHEWLTIGVRGVYDIGLM
jgi:hypothetical protein